MSLLRNFKTGREISYEGLPGELIPVQNNPEDWHPVQDKTLGGVKYDDGKLRYDLIPSYPMEQLAAVYTFGAKKYADWNWSKGIIYSRLIAAVFRHFWAFVRREDIDPESGLPHLAHCLWNITTLLYFSQYRKDLDDRFVVRAKGDEAPHFLRTEVGTREDVGGEPHTSLRDPSKINVSQDRTNGRGDDYRPRPDEPQVGFGSIGRCSPIPWNQEGWGSDPTGRNTSESRDVR